MGTWSSLVVVKEKDLIKIPTDLMPIEVARCRLTLSNPS
jgi:hypothetical protein